MLGWRVISIPYNLRLNEITENQEEKARQIPELDLPRGEATTKNQVDSMFDS